jgi:hypothetical protein
MTLINSATPAPATHTTHYHIPGGPILTPGQTFYVELRHVGGGAAPVSYTYDVVSPGGTTIARNASPSHRPFTGRVSVPATRGVAHLDGSGAVVLTQAFEQYAVAICDDAMGSTKDCPQPDAAPLLPPCCTCGAPGVEYRCDAIPDGIERTPAGCRLLKYRPGPPYALCKQHRHPHMKETDFATPQAAGLPAQPPIAECGSRTCGHDHAAAQCPAPVQAGVAAADDVIDGMAMGIAFRDCV